MDAFLAMQLESLMLFSLVAAAFTLRFIMVQIALCLHRKAVYEQQINILAAKQKEIFAPANIPIMPTVVSPAQIAVTYPHYSVV